MKTKTLVFQLIFLVNFSFLFIVGCRPVTKPDIVSTKIITKPILPTPTAISTLPKTTQEAELPTPTLPQPTASPTIMPTNSP